MSDRKELKEEFLEEWPLKRVRNMTLDEYTNLNREDSFCYWLESTTEKVGSIWGGSAYKFGIYKRNNTEKEDSRDAYRTDGEYGWVAKYGDTAQDAFQNIRALVVGIIEAAQQDNLEAINDIDLGPATKWKIAFLYSDYQVINIFKSSAIYDIAKRKGLESSAQKPISELHRYLITQKHKDTAYFDYTDQLWKTYNKLSKSIESIKEKTTKSVNHIYNDVDVSLNTILFGPPGTGKTYHTVDYALSIVDPDYYQQHKDDRKKLVERFRELRITDWNKPGKGRIAFTTFHQSFTYEDFIEGIKPKLSNDKEADESTSDEESQDQDSTGSKIRYTIEDGIFKRICTRARQESGGIVQEIKNLFQWDEEDYKQAEFYKVSLDNPKNPDEEVYNYCIENNVIATGLLNDEDLRKVEEEHEVKRLANEDANMDEYDKSSLACFTHNLQRGYYVVIPKGNNKIKALGKVIGNYDYRPDTYISYNHFRDVEWVFIDQDLSADLIYEDSPFSAKRLIHHLRRKAIKPEFFIKSKASKPKGNNEVQPYVLIVDEINRGNIAQIFGELITLIEEDKREDKQEELEATLPYSKEVFSVPSNLYLIGTMNTADRSVEALDSALRRRFQFKEVPPSPEIIAKEGKAENGVIQINDTAVPLPNLLKTINQRIKKVLDKDHLIGHSYFMEVTNWKDLRTVFDQNIIPLLEEYFYGDKGKVQLILGKDFIKSEDGQNEEVFPETEYNDQGIYEDRIVWKISDDWGESAESLLQALDKLSIHN